MNYKKIVSLLTGALLTAALLTGCAASAAPAGSAAGTSASSAASAGAAEADDELARIQKAGSIKVGVEGTYPPVTYHDENGDLVGFDIDVAKAVAQKLGVKAEFVESEWDSLLAGVDSGRLDTVINAVSITDEREEKYDFAGPYFYITRQVVVRTGNDDLHSLDDLKGKKVATNITNDYAPELEKLGVTIVPIETSEEAATLVLSGRADFCMSGIQRSIAELVGETPLMELTGYEKRHGLSARLLAKLEYFNPSGSIKDRAALRMIESAERDGTLRPGDTIVEQTSGNTGIGLAALAVPRGYRLEIFLERGASSERRLMLEAYGARLLDYRDALGRPAVGERGEAERDATLKEIYSYCRRQGPRYHFLDQTANPHNPEAHRLTTGPEIWRDTGGAVDLLVCMNSSGCPV